ncbi:protein-L-isoaspartate O-methyltransferase family protein [Salinarimonas ramus]|uniref:Protein-L-isoaspartate O-methyltransferase n=1 Tax=Salinarimonas ramus TaxID=690164 RepID=A0A917Q859_9HYPH|nr:protein-L-isoaspartate O-methyltransferase [Salinarimonas ramus]GGK30597.1 protein-L-isoaspartate O-methyltransferase [Salinarimonas ramus]
MRVDRQGLSEGDPTLDAEAVETAAFVLALRAKGYRDKAVLGAMERVPRNLFAPRRFADLSRSDVALPLPYGQTMSAPTTVAAMLVALALEEGMAVYEVGTGSGYVSALLARLGGVVESVERIEALCDAAALRLGQLDVAASIGLGHGDGLLPRRNRERFPRMLVNGALPAFPDTLLERLAPGGRLVGALTVDGFPRLAVVEKNEEGVTTRRLGTSLRIAPLVMR